MMIRKVFSLFSLLITCFFVAACGTSESSKATNTTAATNANVAVNTNINRKPEPPRNPQTPFEKALFSVRVAELDQVLVFERKDKNPLNKEDKEFLRANSPNETGREVNRWTLTEDNKYAIAGTNFKFKAEQIAALQKRFDVKDFSQGDGVEINLSDYAANEKKMQPENANQNK
jgi:hypothetical protein